MSDVEQVSGENEIEINKRMPTSGRLQSSCQLQTTPKSTIKQYQQQRQQHHKQALYQQRQLKQQQQQQHQEQHENQLQQEHSSLNVGTTDPLDSAVQSSVNSQQQLTWFNKILRVSFSAPGLLVLVVAYSVMGAFIFPLLEAPQDMKKSIAIAKSREDCLRELWTITEKLNVLYERNWTMLVHEQLRRFEGSIVAATRNGAGDDLDTVDDTSFSGGTSSLSSVPVSGYETADRVRWSFSEALLYSVTVITTIGHGSLTPRTAGGKIATILYALIGVPLMLMCLSSLGGLLAEALQCTYTKISCSFGGGRYQCRRRRRRQSSTDSDSGAETTTCHGQSHEMDCKSCKYDSVVGETDLNSRYDYGSSSVTKRGEDSCQLLHSSPINKVNHSSPCMQVKPSPPPSAVMFGRTMANAQNAASANAYHMQQQQQQQQQQPDVMLMTTGVKHHHMYMHPYHQQPPHQIPTPSSSTGGSVCTSPHPHSYTMQTSCQNNGSSLSPTPSIREYYHLQQQQQQQQQQQNMQQQKQQDTATPNNVVRLNSACNVIGVCGAVGINSSGTGTGSRFVGNYCNTSRPGDPASGTATIYFPLTAAATPCLGVGVAGIRVAAPSIQYNHPMVKYHTIQLQQRKPMDQQQNSNAMGTSILPPPPYQTATVHGIRRAKFLTKPMPQEINTLLAESDISCRHDLSGNTTTSLSSSPPPSSSSIVTSSGDGICTSTVTNSAGLPPPVDIMDDEEENEQNRAGNCLHGTPSRVPLISSGKSGNSVSSGGGGSETSADCDTENVKSSGVVGGILGQRRGIMLASAVNRQRSSNPLHSFHHVNTNGDKRKITNSGAMKPVTKRIAGGGGCYGGDTTTEDDDEYDDDDDDDDDDENNKVYNSDGDVIDTGGDDDETKSENENSTNPPPQVPITVVLLILICYICLGTVIFAFWENWSFIDGAYFCFVTLSTIGYGDFIPERTFHGPEMQLFACCAYLLLGLVLVAMSFSILETQLLWKCRRIAVRLKLAKD